MTPIMTSILPDSDGNVRTLLNSIYTFKDLYIYVQIRDWGAKEGGKVERRGCIPPFCFTYHKNPKTFFIYVESLHIKHTKPSTRKGKKSCGHERGASSEKEERSK